MVKGFILVGLVPGLEEEALSQISTLPGIVEVTPVFGHWDTMVIVEAKTLDELSKKIIHQIRGIRGVENTETLIAGFI